MIKKIKAGMTSYNRCGDQYTVVKKSKVFNNRWEIIYKGDTAKNYRMTSEILNDLENWK